MSRFAAASLAFVICALAAHAVVVFGAPGAIMSAVRAQIEGGGLPLHHWQASPRATPQNQTIVRPSPDLAYAICLIDVSAGPVTITVPTAAGYGSLSIFDGRTDNVFVTSLDAAVAQAPNVTVTIGLASALPPTGGAAVRLKTPEALALIRRLAPNDPAHEAAQALVALSSCKPV